MTNKEILELQKRIYAISYSGFPLDSFFNDIEKNDNQRFNKDLAYKDLKLIVDEIYKLKDKAKKYDEKEKSTTLEEVKKEWEELGYEWKETGKLILLDNNIEKKAIRIYKSLKLYHVKALGEDYYEIVSFALHQLLTKTFKALRWGGCND